MLGEVFIVRSFYRCIYKAGKGLEDCNNIIAYRNGEMTWEKDFWTLQPQRRLS